MSICPASGFYRGVRGGSWSGDLQFARVARRDYDPPGFRFSGVGLRLMRRVS